MKPSENKPTEYQMDWSNLDTVPVLFLTLTPLLTIAVGIYYFTHEVFNPWFLLLFAFFYFATGMSITGGYHRLFAHKSYEANWWVRLLLLLFGAGAFQNSAKKWCGDHRVHHRYVDQDTDPYSINKGFWYAHLFWMFEKSDLRESKLGKMYSRDLVKDPMIAWQDKHYILIAVFMGIILPTLIGAAMGSWVGGLFFGGLLRMVIVHHFTFFINSLAHYWGSRPYTDTNTARDNGFVALFTYGEGYHNFHHIFHADYRNGVRWYHYDPTKWMIRFMSYFNWAQNLRRTPDYEIFKARMEMLEKYKQSNTTYMERYEHLLGTLKSKADEAHVRLNQLIAEYNRLRSEMATTQLKSMRTQIDNAKREVRYLQKQWRLCLKAAH